MTSSTKAGFNRIGSTAQMRPHPVFPAAFVSICLITGGISAQPADEPSPHASTSSDRVLLMFFNPWQSKQTGYSAKQFLFRAAAMRDDVAAVAADHIRSVRGNESLLKFCIDILSERHGVADAQLLVDAAQNNALSHSVRRAAVNALESFCDKQLLENGELHVEESEQDLAARLKTIQTLLTKAQPPGNDSEAQRAAEIIREYITGIATRLRDERSVKEVELDTIQAQLEVIKQASDPRVAAPLLMGLLDQLTALPAAMPADSVDNNVIGLLEFQTLSGLQKYIGPIVGLSTALHKREQVEPIVPGVREWWNSAKEKAPTEWQMDRLALSGYRTTAQIAPNTIGTELLRALLTGTPAESATAGRVMKDLGICSARLPVRDITSRDDVLLCDAMARSLIAAEASAAMLDGQLPQWNNALRTWTLQKPR